MKDQRLHFLASVIFFFTSFAHAQINLDTYGGIAGASSPNGGTGYFRLEKFNNRWLFVTPAGNYFWMRAVQSVDPGDGGTVEVNKVAAKYPLGRFQWGDQANRRLNKWGFNTIGEYSYTYVLPDPMYGSSTSSTVPHPYIRIIKPSAYAGDSRFAYHVKDVVFGMSTTYYRDYRGHLADVFDPAFATVANDLAKQDDTTYGLDNSKYLIGTTTDDLDELFGFGGGPNTVDTSWRHPEIGWMVAITGPSQSVNQDGTITYTDQTVYSKAAWANFLAQKYGTISALNSAWGANYTTFGSAGGYGVGSGLLDEDGRHSWIGNDNFALSNTNSSTAADMRAFTQQFADKYFSVVATAIRTYTPHHLVFGPDAIGASARPGILAAAAKWVDVVQVTSYYANTNALLQQAYGSMGRDKPLLGYLLTTACANSPYATSCTQQGSSTDYASQTARGSAHANFVNALYSFTASNAVQPVVGADMWEWTDKTIGGERGPFGLVTVLDNAQDGKENVIAAGLDAWGFPTGGEAANYGDFLSAVTAQNKQVDSNVLALFGGTPPPPPPAPVAPTASLSASPSSIRMGQTTTLAWSTQNAASVSITGIGTVPASGSKAVSPSATNSYVLTATGTGGTKQVSITITVSKRKTR